MWKIQHATETVVKIMNYERKWSLKMGKKRLSRSPLILAPFSDLKKFDVAWPKMASTDVKAEEWFLFVALSASIAIDKVFLLLFLRFSGIALLIGNRISMKTSFLKCHHFKVKWLHCSINGVIMSQFDLLHVLLQLGQSWTADISIEVHNSF